MTKGEQVWIHVAVGFLLATVIADGCRLDKLHKRVDQLEINPHTKEQEEIVPTFEQSHVLWHLKNLTPQTIEHLKNSHDIEIRIKPNEQED